jgi:hypothetical protein
MARLTESTGPFGHRLVDAVVEYDMSGEVMSGEFGIGTHASYYYEPGWQSVPDGDSTKWFRVDDHWMVETW